MQRLQYFEFEVTAKHRQAATAYCKLDPFKPGHQVEEKWKLLNIDEV